MRDARTGTATKARKKPKQLPRLSPKDFAVDITPRGTKVSKEARGTAMLMRGSFETYLRKHDDKLGPGQKKALNLLRHDRISLLKPENHQYLAALQRVQPDTSLGKAIAKDKHLSRQHRLLVAGVSLAPESRLKLQQQGLKDNDIDRLAAGEMHPREASSAIAARQEERGQQLARTAEQKLGKKQGSLNYDVKTQQLIPTKAPGDWFGRLAGGAMESVVGMAPFAYHMGTTDPRKSIPEVGGALKESFGETFTHPLRQLKKDPFAFLSNTVGMAGVGVGVGGRLSSLGAAVAERAPGTSALRAAAHGYTHPEVRSLIDLYENKSPGAQRRIAAENNQIAEAITEAFETPTARIKGVRGKLISAARDVKEGMKETRRRDIDRPREISESAVGFVGPLGSHVLAGGEQTLRELTDGVRAGAIYLRPAYLPNNWAGNTFMNLTSQGFMAPINLAKSLYMHRKLSARELRGLRAATGQTAAHAIMGKGRGYARAISDPVAQAMGKLADQPFRDSAMLHALRRKGYKNLDQVKALLRDADNGDQAALKVLGDSGRRAQEEIVKFGKMSDTERSVARNVFFVYNWMKGATRYAARFPLAHPIQTSVYATGSDIGNKYVQKQTGGLPPYLVGSIPIGGGKMINPFTLNPLGTGVQVGRAAQGTIAQLRGGGRFDPHTMEDWTSLMNPVWGGVLEAREGIGGRSYYENLTRNLAPVRLYEGLAHPGSGSTFPGTRMEAIGHYVFGSLFPRKYDPKALQASLERMNVNHPEKMIEGMVKRYEKKTGQKVPPQLISAYRKDLEELKAQKDFKTDFAHKHNRPSYRKLPPITRAQAALEYIEEHHIVPKEQLDQFKQVLDSVDNDTAAGSLANAWWSMTNAGNAKRAWQSLMGTLKQTELTRGS